MDFAIVCRQVDGVSQGRVPLVVPVGNRRRSLQQQLRKISPRTAIFSLSFVAPKQLGRHDIVIQLKPGKLPE